MADPDPIPFTLTDEQVVAAAPTVALHYAADRLTGEQRTGCETATASGRPTVSPLQPWVTPARCT